MTWKACLRQAGLRQHEVAAKIGTSESRLSRAVHGRAKLYPEELSRLAQVLRVPVEEVGRLMPISDR